VSADVVSQPTSAVEIEAVLGTITRSLADARVEGLSADGRFSHAYGAVLGAATVVLRSEGLRVRGAEHHKATFAAVADVLGEAYRDRIRYFDRCRIKRNNAAYDAAVTVSDAEVHELVRQAESFTTDVIAWVRANHPELLRG
jgi:uncharacterized protein (UPF0332 family)